MWLCSVSIQVDLERSICCESWQYRDEGRDPEYHSRHEKNMFLQGKQNPLLAMRQDKNSKTISVRIPPVSLLGSQCYFIVYFSTYDLPLWLSL